MIVSDRRLESPFVWLQAGIASRRACRSVGKVPEQPNVFLFGPSTSLAACLLAPGRVFQRCPGFSGAFRRFESDAHLCAPQLGRASCDALLRRALLAAIAGCSQRLTGFAHPGGIASTWFALALLSAAPKRCGSFFAVSAEAEGRCRFCRLP
jgi:hypothetical protein